MSEELTVRALRQAFYDRLYGSFVPKLAIHPDSRKSLGKWAKEVLGAESTPSGEVAFFMGVEVMNNLDVPPGKLRIDRAWTDADVDLWALSRGEDFLKWKLPPADFNLPIDDSDSDTTE